MVKPLIGVMQIQARELIHQAASGFQALGMEKGQAISFFADNSAPWLITEQASALNGCPTAVRGAAAPIDELHYIYDHSDSAALVVHNPALLRRLASNGLPTSKYGKPRFVLLLSTDGEDPQALSDELEVPVLSSEELLALGEWHR